MAVDAPGFTDMLRTYRESCVLSHSPGERRVSRVPTLAARCVEENRVAAEQ